jgi:queuine tRNA-ribosyltransferase
VAGLGGVHALSGFDGPMLTDSGGYQAYSLDPVIDDDGMTFTSVYDGSPVRLTPEEAVDVQARLGADVAMVLDDCPGLPATPERIDAAVARTSRWAARAREAHTATGQALFGIVQGGTDTEQRARSARDIVALGFDGYAVGGLSLAAAGIDLFDSVWPTRRARHGTALRTRGAVSVKAAAQARSSDPIEADCPCEACRSLSLGALRHLFMVHEPLAARLLTVHNLTHIGRLMARIRAAIRSGTLPDLAATEAATDRV